jgi:hypothetical protein
MKRPASFLATVFLALVALAHVLRIVFSVDTNVAGVELPLWVSVPAIIVPGGIALWLWKERQHVN